MARIGALGRSDSNRDGEDVQVHPAGFALLGFRDVAARGEPSPTELSRFKSTADRIELSQTEKSRRGVPMTCVMYHIRWHREG